MYLYVTNLPSSFSLHFLSIYYELSEWVAGELFRSCNKATLRKSEAGVEIRVGLFLSQIYSFNLMLLLDSESI